MNIIYLHGFKSNSNSIKGKLLQHYCAKYPEIQVHLPDLNMSPNAAIVHVSGLIESMHDVALLGSSLGWFYATHLVAQHAVPAVLINPAMRPWQLFRELFDEQLPYQVHPKWCLDEADLVQLQQLALPVAQDADKILVCCNKAMKFWIIVKHIVIIVLRIPLQYWWLKRMAVTGWMILRKKFRSSYSFYWTA